MIVLIGERANGAYAMDQQSTDARVRLRHGAFRWGPARDRLMKLGLRWDAAANLLPRQPTREAAWDAEARAQAAAAAEAMWVWAAQTTDTTLVLCGSRVAKSFGLSFDPLVRQSATVELDQEDRVVVPAYVIAHPSGLSRWWNEAGNREAARALFAQLSERCYGHESFYPISSGNGSHL